MFAEDHCARFFVSEKPENLRGLAIKTFAELHVRRDWLLPPIVFYVPIFFNVAHGSCFLNDWSWPALRPRREGAPSPCLASETHALLCGKVSRCIKFRVNATAGEEFRTAALFDDASVI